MFFVGKRNGEGTKSFELFALILLLLINWVKIVRPKILCKRKHVPSHEIAIAIVYWRVSEVKIKTGIPLGLL